MIIDQIRELEEQKEAIDHEISELKRACIHPDLKIYHETSGCALFGTTYTKVRYCTDCGFQSRRSLT